MAKAGKIIIFLYIDIVSLFLTAICLKGFACSSVTEQKIRFAGTFIICAFSIGFLYINNRRSMRSYGNDTLLFSAFIASLVSSRLNILNTCGGISSRFFINPSVLDCFVLLSSIMTSASLIFYILKNPETESQNSGKTVAGLIFTSAILTQVLSFSGTEGAKLLIVILYLTSAVSAVFDFFSRQVDKSILNALCNLLLTAVSFISIYFNTGFFSILNCILAAICMLLFILLNLKEEGRL